MPLVYGNFIDLITELFRPERRLGRLKEFTHYFAKNYKFGHQLSTWVQNSKSMNEACERAGFFFEQEAGGQRDAGKADNAVNDDQ
jgi:hypothetical protein